MKKSIQSIRPICLLAILWSCQTIIDVDLPKHEPRIVLNSFFGTDTTFVFNISLSRGILESELFGYTNLSGATIEVFEDGTSIGYATLTADEAYYELPKKSKPGSTYSVQASMTGYPDVKATDLVPSYAPTVTIDKFTTVKDEYGGEAKQLTYHFDDPSGEDFYELLLYMEVPRWDYYEDEDTSYVYQAGTMKELIYFNKVGAELNEFEDYDDTGLFNDNLFDGKRHSETIEYYFYYYDNGETASEDPKLYLELRRVSEAYYNYKTSRSLQQNAVDNPFAEAAQVYNNVEDGYGIFASYNANEISFTIPPDE
ncbi:DUF4249 domain-containing protein [Marinoscillum sp.]|uniref:DUF4249 domain-containing protein n=1 Tax=Marinoscillum sp. TaxID=2024838 RepID=UPI003BAB09AD